MRSKKKKSSQSLDVWGRADWRDQRLLLPSGAVAIAITVAPSASRPRKRDAPTPPPSARPSQPISSLSSAYVHPAAMSSPLVVWVRILAPDVDSPPSSPLLDPDDFSLCVEISFDEAATAHAAYHAWNLDTELQRRWFNVFPSPARLPSTPEDTNSTPTGTAQSSSDIPPLPSPNRALSAMREILTSDASSDPPVPPPICSAPTSMPQSSQSKSRQSASVRASRALRAKQRGWWYH